jgi:hypothetical protein
MRRCQVCRCTCIKPRGSSGSASRRAWRFYVIWSEMAGCVSQPTASTAMRTAAACDTRYLMPTAEITVRPITDVAQMGLLPIPDISNQRFPEAKKHEAKGFTSHVPGESGRPPRSPQSGAGRIRVTVRATGSRWLRVPAVLVHSGDSIFRSAPLRLAPLPARSRS